MSVNEVCLYFSFSALNLSILAVKCFPMKCIATDVYHIDPLSLIPLGVYAILLDFVFYLEITLLCTFIDFKLSIGDLTFLSI